MTPETDAHYGVVRGMVTGTRRQTRGTKRDLEHAMKLEEKLYELYANNSRLMAERAELAALVKRIQDALGTGEEGENLVDVARAAHSAERELAGRITKEEQQ